MNKSFSIALGEFAKKTRKNARTVLLWAGESLQNDVAADTPVDTGRARAGWNLQIGAVDPTVPPKGAAGYAPRGTRNTKGAGNTLFLSNNVEYIAELERGHSKQAPNGMLKRNVNRWKRYIRDAVRKL